MSAPDQPPTCPVEPPAPFRLNLRQRARDYYFKLMESPGRIDQVAGGFAIGIFFGFSPWHGFHLLLTFAVCALLRRSYAAGALGAIVFNAFTAFIIFPVELEVGKRVLHSGRIRLPPELKFDYVGLRQLLHSGERLFWPYLVGSLIVGGVSAAVSYFWVETALRAYRQRVYLRKKHEPDA